MKSVAIFASGNGSNFESIIKYFENKDVKFTLITNNEDSYVRDRAKRLGIEEFYVKFSDTYDFLVRNKFDLFVLAGYMRILPEKVLNLGTFINIHPSFLPEFKGVDSIKRAYDSGKEYSGVSIHYVEEQVDSGEIIIQEKILIETDMTLIDLEKKVHEVEHYLYPRVIEKLLLNCEISKIQQEILS